MTLFNQKKLTEKQFTQKLENLRRMIREKVTTFPADTSAKKKARIARAEDDSLYFIQTYLPHYCDEPFAEFHQELVDIAKAASVEAPAAGDAPRGGAKSTIVTFGLNLQEILFRKCKFPIVVQDTETQAAGITSALMAEMEENPRIKADFGNLKGTSWSETDFTTSTGIRVLARGVGQGMRGLKNGPHRPDRIYIDDGENDESAKNPNRCKAFVNWVLRAALPSLNPKTGRLFIVGTMLTKKSSLAQLKANPKFKDFHFKAIKDDGTSFWPERFPIEYLTSIRETIGVKAFSAEYQNEPQDDQAGFEGAWLENFYDPEILKDKEQVTATWGDPSSKSGQHNDFKAVITISLCPEGIYVRHAWIRHATPDGLVGALYDQYEDYKPDGIGSEDNAIGEFLRSALELKAQERGYPLPLIAKTTSSNKEARILRLSPLAEHKKIFFIKGHSDQDLLREQLEAFPSSSVHDDGPDALEGAVSLAEGKSCKPAMAEKEPEKKKGFLQRGFKGFGFRRKDAA